MKNYLLALLIIGSFLFTLSVKCADDSSSGGGTEETTTESLTNLTDSGSETIADALQGIEGGAESDSAYNNIYPNNFMKETFTESFFSKLMGFSFGSPVFAGTASTNKFCPKGGSVDIYTNVDKPWSSDTTTFQRVMTYDDCKKGTDQKAITLTGNDVLYWIDLKKGLTGKDKIVEGTVLYHGVADKKFKGVNVNKEMTVEGNGDSINASNGSETINAKTAHTKTWKSVSTDGTRTLEVTSSLTRKGYKDGVLKWHHNISTPSALNVTVVQNATTGVYTKTINSGQISVEHVKAGFTMLITFKDVVINFNVDDCVPSSGTATFTLSGNKTGEGQINYDGENTTFDFTSSDGTTVKSSPVGLVKCKK